MAWCDDAGHRGVARPRLEPGVRRSSTSTDAVWRPSSRAASPCPASGTTPAQLRRPQGRDARVRRRRPHASSRARRPQRDRGVVDVLRDDRHRGRGDLRPGSRSSCRCSGGTDESRCASGRASFRAALTPPTVREWVGDAPGGRRRSGPTAPFRGPGRVHRLPARDARRLHDVREVRFEAICGRAGTAALLGASTAAYASVVDDRGAMRRSAVCLTRSSARSELVADDPAHAERRQQSVARAVAGRSALRRVRPRRRRRHAARESCVPSVRSTRPEVSMAAPPWVVRTPWVSQA